MNQVFELFAKTIRKLPVEVILKVLERESTMLEEDYLKRSLPLSDDGQSIISFQQFVRLVKNGEGMLFVAALTPEHIQFYKQTITRLTRVHELPESAMELFDKTFSVSK